MNTDTIEVSETTESAPSIKDAAVRATVTAVVSVVVTAVASALLKKAVTKFQNRHNVVTTTSEK